MTDPIGLRGAFWPGAGEEVRDDHLVVIADGCIEQIAPYDSSDAAGLREVIGSAGCWIGPGVYDRHVHLAFGSAADLVAGGVLQARDLGAPVELDLGGLAAASGLRVLASGRLLTAPGGYPSRSWGADGFASFAAVPEEAVRHVESEHARGACVIKVALEDADGQPSLAPDVLAAAVGAAHARGLAVVAHALSVDMVLRALDAGVAELAHTPAELLPADVVQRIADDDVTVCSTLQTFFAEGKGEAAARNAAALIAAGVPMHYATDLGNAGTRAGVDPRELDRLANAGLGRAGALDAASIGRITIGQQARIVVLPENPIAEPAAWRTPVAVLVGAGVTHGR